MIFDDDFPGNFHFSYSFLGIQTLTLNFFFVHDSRICKRRDQLMMTKKFIGNRVKPNRAINCSRETASFFQLCLIFSVQISFGFLLSRLTKKKKKNKNLENENRLFVNYLR